MHWAILPNDCVTNSETINLLNQSKKEHLKSSNTMPVVWKHLKESFIVLRKNLISYRSLFTAPSQLFYGLLGGFIWSDFTRSFVSCTLGVHSVGLCMFIVNSTSSMTTLLIALVTKKISVRFLAVSNILLDLPTCLLSIVWTPSSDTSYFPYVLATIFGVCHGLSRTIIFTIPVKYFLDIDAGYTLCSCWMSVGVLLSQFISVRLCTISVLYVVMAWSLLSSFALLVGDFLIKEDSEK